MQEDALCWILAASTDPKLMSVVLMPWSKGIHNEKLLSSAKTGSNRAQGLFFWGLAPRPPSGRPLASIRTLVGSKLVSHGLKGSPIENPESRTIDFLPKSVQDNDFGLKLGPNESNRSCGQF